MSGRDSVFVKKMDVEVYMIDPFYFDPDNEVIASYIEQQMRTKDIVPPVDTLIPISIGSSAGLMKVVKKNPSRAFKFPANTKREDYFHVSIKRMNNRGSTLRWEYRPNNVEPFWEDDMQFRNARLLETYLTNPEVRRTSPLILMDGQPGTGKSMVIDYVLSKLRERFTVLKQVTVASSFIGETAQNIIDITNEAIESRPCIVVFEESDGTFMSRWMADPSASASRHHAEEVISTMLQCIDNMAKMDDIFIIATTNMNPDDAHIIDPAILSRVGMRLSFRNPPEETVKKVMRALSDRDKVPLENVQSAMKDIVGSRSPNYRDITAAVNRAHMLRLADLDCFPKNELVRKRRARDLAYIY